MKTSVVKLICYHSLLVPGHMKRMKSGSLSHFYFSNSKYTFYSVTHNCFEHLKVIQIFNLASALPYRIRFIAIAQIFRLFSSIRKGRYLINFLNLLWLLGPCLKIYYYYYCWQLYPCLLQFLNQNQNKKEMNF